VPGEALETMIELCFWPSIVSNILQLYLVHSTFNGFLCIRAMKEGKT
jgi:hypothetical protein